MHKMEKRILKLKRQERRHLARQRRSEKRKHRKMLKKYKKNCKRTFGSNWRSCYKKLKVQCKYNYQNRLNNEKN